MKKTIHFLFLFASFLLTYAQGVDKSIPTVNGQNSGRILFIVSNAHFYGDSEQNTSNHFSEIVHAYDVFDKAGYKMDFVSPEGGAIPIGYINTSDSLQKQYLYDNDFMDALEHTHKPAKIKASNYVAVYYGGGGAAMFGVPENKDIQRIVMQMYENHKGIIATICHGTAGIVNLKTKDGTYLVSGKKVNGFPDAFENMEADYYKTFPFSIQQLITKRGGDFQFSPKGWDGFMVADDRLITGQDPSAAASVAKKVVDVLQRL
ncbi:type 1 glutamine amidotransferase domain-containing protein [Aquimarina rubra]|uniref:Type 1 glutamine amidotransferase domain-containing protein n=1 Tax=Aquimarina rubra TaxID=1920033 RepID=A0ABW5LBN9_9FLAO